MKALLSMCIILGACHLGVYAVREYQNHAAEMAAKKWTKDYLDRFEAPAMSRFLETIPPSARVCVKNIQAIIRECYRTSGCVAKNPEALEVYWECFE